MNITLAPADRSDIKKIKKLYKRAFPSNERAPFGLLARRAAQRRAELLAAHEDGIFVGFVYLVCDSDLVYLFYFAVEEHMRGRGVGSAILCELREYCRGKRIFLAREQLDEDADNIAQRRSRHEFYLHSGFVDLGSTITEADVTYDVMGIGGAVLPEEYDRMMRTWSGPIFSRMVKMRYEV